MAEHDDQQWLSVLAGRKPDGAAIDDAREAEAVRAAILATRRDHEAADHDVEAGTQRLLFRLRRENLIYKKKSWQFYGGMAIAAALALAIGLTTMRPPVEDTPVYRGAGAQSITTPDAGKLAAALTAELEALGIKPRVTRFGSNYSISAEWPAKPDARHAAFLKQHGLQPPTGGVLTIELSPSGNAK